MSKTQKEFNIEGMTCAACSAAVERAVGKQDGVTSANVNLTTEKMRVFFDSELINEAQIEEAVRKSGYKASVNENLAELELEVQGMTCASCSAAVERGLNKLEFVKSAQVNLIEEKARVMYDANYGTAAQIEEAVRKAGYTPVLINGKTEYDSRAQKKERELRVQKLKLIAAAVFFRSAVLYSNGADGRPSCTGCNGTDAKSFALRTAADAAYHSCNSSGI